MIHKIENSESHSFLWVGQSCNLRDHFGISSIFKIKFSNRYSFRDWFTLNL